MHVTCPDCGREFTKRELSWLRFRNKFRCPDCASMLGFKLLPMHVFAVITFVVAEAIIWFAIFLSWPVSLLSREYWRLIVTAAIPCGLAFKLASRREELKKVSDE